MIKEADAILYETPLLNQLFLGSMSHATVRFLGVRKLGRGARVS
jgi:hypothetical protein